MRLAIFSLFSVASALSVLPAFAEAPPLQGTAQQQPTTMKVQKYNRGNDDTSEVRDRQPTITGHSGTAINDNYRLRRPPVSNSNGRVRAINGENTTIDEHRYYRQPIPVRKHYRDR